MSNEISCQLSAQVNKGSVKFTNSLSSFRMDMDGARGPTPGSFVVTPEGVDVDLSNLVSPGLVIVANQDDPSEVTDNWITYGVYDPEEERFICVGEVHPGQGWPLYLSRYFGQEMGTGSGTGDIGDGTTRLRLKSENANAQGFIGAFER